MRETVEKRHERILRLVREREQIRVTALAAELGVSVETARRDIAALADVGRLRRTHGSVAWPTAPVSAREARLTRHARRPARRKRPVLGVVVPVAGYFFQRVILGARAAADAAGVRLMIGITDYRRARDSAQLRALLQAGVDGLLLAPTWEVAGPNAADLAELTDVRTPAVLVERQVPIGLHGAEIDRVSSDHAEGAALAVRHLAGLGHRRIALLTRETHTRPHIVRGYRAAMAALGLPGDELSPAEPVQLGDYGTFEQEVRVLLDLAEAGEVRAAIAHTDVDAINTLQELAARGIQVPRDFALVSYDDEIAGLADVPLTSIAPHKRAVGETAVRLLLRRLADPSAQHSHVELIPELRVRDSCGGTRTGSLPA